MAEPLLALRNIRVQYGAETVLDLPFINICDREIVAIVGANGAGKSTLVRVMGLLERRPTCGSISFRGKPAAPDDYLTLRRRIASVLQAPLLLDDTVYANVALGLKLRAVSREQVEGRLRPWLERLGIVELANRGARTLSGGEARRACLARALVLEPELLLLDEPFSGLDSPSRAVLLPDLQRVLTQTGAAVVIVTHDPREAAALANRTGVLSRGRLLQMASTEEIFSHPASQEVTAFLDMQERTGCLTGAGLRCSITDV